MASVLVPRLTVDADSFYRRQRARVFVNAILRREEKTSSKKTKHLMERPASLSGGKINNLLIQIPAKLTGADAWMKSAPARIRV